MSWSIPAKTFLLGEYVALSGGPAVLLTTTPCFEVGLSSEEPHAVNAMIHPDSPAGRFWATTGIDLKLTWHDPYDGIGGLGASSAQFLGAYLAFLSVKNETFNQEALLKAYWASSFREGEGMRPSGYDVLAQASSGCVYLDRNNQLETTYAWPFDDVAFILLHTGDKLATHHHLQTMRLTDAMASLSPLVLLGKQAFEQCNSQLLIEAVNNYHQNLLACGLVTQKTQEQCVNLNEDPDVLACKGCGALGADVLLVLVPAHQRHTCVSRFSCAGFRVLATSDKLYDEKKSYQIGFTS
jgi:mevalonate kinase